jgi:hypothetical protein
MLLPCFLLLVAMRLTRRHDGIFLGVLVQMTGG